MRTPIADNLNYSGGEWELNIENGLAGEIWQSTTVPNMADMHVKSNVSHSLNAVISGILTELINCSMQDDRGNAIRPGQRLFMKPSKEVIDEAGAPAQTVTNSPWINVISLDKTFTRLINIMPFAAGLATAAFKSQVYAL
jgi:hypothetical protein